MTPPGLSPRIDPPARPLAHPPASWCTFTGFGVRVVSDLPVAGGLPLVSGFAHADAGATPSLIITAGQSISSIGERSHDAPITLIERRKHSGELVMRITQRHDFGYRVEAPEHGTFTVPPNGSAIYHERLQRPTWRWHRPLCAQVLPIAATLQGFELLHASAVEIHGRAIGFIADSGTGKSSLATQLNVRGAPLLTDDVLSLENREGTVVAHPGVRLANLAPEQLAPLSPTERAALGTPIGRSDKVHIAIANMAAGAVPLGALCYLQRSSRIDRIAFERADPPDPRDLLAATFMPHIVNAQRLETQLDVCAAIAASVPIYFLRAPAKLSAPELARAVEQHASSLLA